MFVNNNVNYLINKIVNSIDKSWNKNEIIRYVYISLGKELCKDVKFFYSLDKKMEDYSYTFDSLRELYEPRNVETYKVICKSAAMVLKSIFDRLGIESSLIKTVSGNPFIDKESFELLTVYHWFICVSGEKDKKYFMTLVPDLMNIQFNLPTEHFANNIEYKREVDGKLVQVYEGEEIKASIMSDEEIKLIDEKIGYIKPYYITDDNGNRKKVSEYDDVFFKYMLDFIRKDGYMFERAYDTDFFKNALSFKIDGKCIEEYLNSGEIDDAKIELWLDYLKDMVNDKFDINDKEYRDSIGKINGLRSYIKDKKYSKYGIVLGRLAMSFVDSKYKINDDGFCSTEYIKNKFEYLFPLMFGCNDNDILPITSKFKGFGEKLDFVDLVLENMFVELKEKNANRGLKYDPRETLIRNRIQRFSIYDKVNDNYKILFSIDKSNNYYFFDPVSGVFKEVKNLLSFISEGFIIISDELRRKMRQIEDIDDVRSTMEV